MQNEETNPATREKNTAKSCCLLTLVVSLVCLLIITTGIVCLIIVDTINLRGEEHTLSWRAERYKVACQFLWFDFKDWVSKKYSRTVYVDDFRAGESSPTEPEIVQGPAESPGSELESEPEPEQ